jgi:hypothetical protein
MFLFELKWAFQPQASIEQELSSNLKYNKSLIYQRLECIVLSRGLTWPGEETGVQSLKNVENIKNF